jgi:hypothetical protein
MLSVTVCGGGRGSGSNFLPYILQHFLSGRVSQNECYSFAQDVSVGDYVFTSNLRRVKVIDVKELFIHDDYAYAPLTFEGTIIVNDIIASCYGTYSHSTMHMLTTPIRWWYLIVFQFRRVMELDRLQKLTSNLIVYFIDFYLK